MYRRERTTSLALALAMLLMVACGDSGDSETSGNGAPAAEVATPSEAGSPTEAASPAATPAAPAAAEEAAVAKGPHDPKAGEALYAQYCATCHGMRGAGDGPAAQALEPKPAKHDDGAYMNALSNLHLFTVIKEGGPSVGKSPLMAPWGGSLSDEQIWDVVAFVRSLADPPYTGPKP